MSSTRSYHRDQQLRAIEKHEAKIRQAATDRGFVMAIRGDGTHWDFRRAGTIIDWWPGSGKVAVNKRFDERRRADDVAQIVAILEANKAPVAPPPVARPVLPARPDTVAILAAFDFQSLAVSMKAAGFTYGTGAGRRNPGASELHRTADYLLSAARPGGRTQCGILFAEVGADGPRLGVVSVAP